MNFSIHNPVFRLNNEANEFNERGLFSNQLDEVCTLYGAQCFYITQEQNNIDEIFGESPNKVLKDAIEIYLWCDQFEEDFYNEDTAIHSKFGFTLNMTEATFWGSSAYFADHGITPRVSDLIYYKKANKVFEIKKTTDQNEFKIKLDCELYNYDNINIDETTVFEPEILDLESINDKEVIKIQDPVESQITDEQTTGNRINNQY